MLADSAVASMFSQACSYVNIIIMHMEYHVRICVQVYPCSIFGDCVRSDTQYYVYPILYVISVLELQISKAMDGSMAHSSEYIASADRCCGNFCSAVKRLCPNLAEKKGKL